MLLLQALAWAAFFVLVVPHNDQVRFLMPTLVISLVGWAWLLDRLRRTSPAAAQLIWFAGGVGLAVGSRPWEGWTTSFATLARAEVSAVRWILTAALCGIAVTGAYALRHRFGPGAAGVAPTQGFLPISYLMAAWGLIAIATLHSDSARQASFAVADYRGWAEGYLPFNHPAHPASRIAYTGANVPYALAGVGWRHRVIYVDTQSEQGDSFFQHWSRDRREYAYHKPGLYRGQDDVDVWLRHLEELKIDTLVIFRLHRAEQGYIRSTPEGFPVEQAWARQRPDRFEPVFTGPAAEIYRLLPAARGRPRSG